jgi:exonuclease SbcC
VRFDRIRLSNFKCYADADVTLDAGVTVIHGLNGSGKSSLLEACFFALYGASALDRTLEEVVTIGADDAEVELWFTHGDASFHLERRIRATGDEPKTATCTLETPSGTLDGVRDVEGYVTDLLRMDDEAFVNCAYVRQGEVNKLINASPSDRQDMIDDLLQLGKLEEYRSRAGDARLAVGEVRNSAAAQLEQLDESIAEKEDAEPFETLNDLQTERSEVAEEIERFEENRGEASETLSDAEATLEAVEGKREELSDLAERVEELEGKITTTESQRDELQEQAREHDERAAELGERVESLVAETDFDDAEPEAVEAQRADLAERREAVQGRIQSVGQEITSLSKDAESQAERAEDLAERAEAKREDAAELDAEAERATEKLAEREETIEELEAEIEAKREAFADAPAAFGEAEAHVDALEEKLAAARERETELREELASAKSLVAEGEELLAEGNCPECGQPVDGSPHVDALDERQGRVEELEADLADAVEERESIEERVERAESLVDVEDEVGELESQLDSVERLVAERREGVTEKREGAETLREEAEELDAEAKEAREAAEDARERAAAKREEMGELNAEHGDLRERVERLDDLADAMDDCADAEDAAERLREKRADLADRNDERRDLLADLRERKQNLESEFDEERVEEARAAKKKAEEYLEHVESKLAELRERASEIDGRIGAVTETIEELERLRDRRESVAERVDALQSLHEETETLEATYGDLRAELRQRNVDELERLLNETFELVYQNDSYSRIELSGEYELTVYQKDGEALDPEQLSGGERALFNLSLRCAIYRLLSEGIEGAAPMPPLILDEPTVFLDSGHVSQLAELVDSMRQLGVEQIVVVSHDDELVAAADDVVWVEKDSVSNRSTVERREDVLEAAR